MSLAEAYASCERLARAHYENFPVASRLLPAPLRPHLAAIYAFARTADDFADVEGLDDATRLAMLDKWERFLRGETPTRGAELSIFPALHHTIATHRLPIEWFADLLSAFRQDVTTTRYETWTDVLDYCRRSANPVGRLVLRVAGHDTPSLDRASDAVCTALQLTNFWQDFEQDWRRGRLYVPRQDYVAAGAGEEDLDRREATPEWRRVLGTVTARTRAVFDTGRPVCDGVSGRLGWELRATWLGGRRILDKLERSHFDVFGSRPVLGAADLPPLLWQLVTWKRGS